jgi:hypothetical protein
MIDKMYEDFSSAWGCNNTPIGSVKGFTTFVSSHIEVLHVSGTDADVFYSAYRGALGQSYANDVIRIFIADIEVLINVNTKTEEVRGVITDTRDEVSKYTARFRVSEV